jgi:hypothetical protein
MLHILVSNSTYNNYVKRYNNDVIYKGFKIYTYIEFRKKVFEIFDTYFENTEYQISSYKFDERLSNYHKTEGYQIFFKTNSNNEYRIDLIPIKNFNDNINSDFVYSLSFTLSHRDILDINYEDFTNLNETKEVLMRIGDIILNLDIPKNYVIGNTILQKKINIYMKVASVFDGFNIKMDKCDGFLNDIGLYIWK